MEFIETSRTSRTLRALRTCPTSRSRRDTGIALMVVMVVFIILYLVVFQLHYTTKVNEQISKNRAADTEASVTLSSMVYNVMVELADDLRNSQNSGGSAGGAPGAGSGMNPPNAGSSSSGGGQNPAAARRLTGQPPTSSAGGAPAAIGATNQISANATVNWNDSIRENIFLVNEQSLNGIDVKIVIVDAERSFDLNRLWEYPPYHAETLSEANEEEAAEGARADSPETLEEMAEDAGESASRKNSTDRLRAGRDDRPGFVGEDGEELIELPQLGASLEWEPPDDERRQATVIMLERAIDMMYRLNTENGFDYQFQPPLPPVLAEAIEIYAFERRSQLEQNFIHLTSELLNVLTGLSASPEVYYGPVPPLRPGDEWFDRSGDFVYMKDEFGDLAGEYIFADEYDYEREEMMAELEMLQESFGEFASFPGFGRLGNPMTRNMREFTEVEDEFGNAMLMVPPMPIGLRDLFCTFSTGKINMNTASVPVLYSLLPLIIETEQDGELQAQTIAPNNEFYRDSFQLAVDERDPSSVEQAANLDGAPTRSVPDETDGSSVADDLALLNSTGVMAGTGMSQEEMAEALAMEGNTDYETNYFTALSQVRLIDGEEGGPEDYLTNVGSATSTRDQGEQTPLQKVIADYRTVMVFGSTFFTATLKAKSEDSPMVNIGYLTLIRDVANSRMEVVQWKEVQR